MCPSEKSKNGPIDVGIAIVLSVSPEQLGNRVDHRLSTCRFLITRRPSDTVYGGYWELPGGKAGPQEGLDACVEREIREEVGLNIRVIHNLKSVEHTYPHGSVRLHPRVCVRTTESQEPRAIEVSDLKWIGLHELAAHDFPEANEEIFVSFRDWLTASRPPAL